MRYGGKTMQTKTFFGFDYFNAGSESNILSNTAGLG